MVRKIIKIGYTNKGFDTANAVMFAAVQMKYWFTQSVLRNDAEKR